MHPIRPLRRLCPPSHPDTTRNWQNCIHRRLQCSEESDHSLETAPGIHRTATQSWKQWLNVTSRLMPCKHGVGCVCLAFAPQQDVASSCHAEDDGLWKRQRDGTMLSEALVPHQCNGLAQRRGSAALASTSRSRARSEAPCSRGCASETNCDSKSTTISGKDRHERVFWLPLEKALASKKRIKSDCSRCPPRFL